MKQSLKDILGIKYPVIMAPMFLVTNARMMIEACNAGIAAAVPALNYRTDEEFRAALDEVREKTEGSGSIGVNLIVNKSNPKMPGQLQTCLDKKIDFIITSLGSPESVIKACKPHGIKVFCDVTDLKYAKKVESLGADALIAVNSRAGGHAGNIPPEELIPLLNENCTIPVISAGGVGNKEDLDRILGLGAAGVSVGSIFIASEESGVSEDYKKACVDYGKDDIVMSTKISGTPCTVINTPYVQKIGTKQNWFEKLLSKSKRLKKWVKMLTFARGMKKLENAAFSATYKTVWCAGPTIENTDKIKPVKEIVKDLVRDE
ncbi:MAG: nitronate monooxygenase [Crocinitomicaceae bacterium]|nr:nitronate monooxygenase [Crocinitomicaceae bacterium]